MDQMYQHEIVNFLEAHFPFFFFNKMRMIPVVVPSFMRNHEIMHV